jgi:hypothetical protein
MNRALWVALVASLLSTSGCATLFNGTKTEVKIDSRPQAASFTIVSNGGGLGSTKDVEVATGTTPAVVNLKNKSEYILTVKLDGYQDAKVPLEQDWSRWVICSGLCGLIPLGIDVLTGGFWKIQPEDVMVMLRPASAMPPGVPGAPRAPGAAPAPGASGEPSDDGRLYLIVVRKDKDGELRQLVVPMIPDIA